MASITLGELHLFYAIEREIFSRLVMKFMRNPGESLLVMAIWLWLEENGRCYIIRKMIDLSDFNLNLVADEAVMCLNVLQSENCPSPAAGRGLVHTSILMEKNISLQLFFRNKFSAICGIKNYLTTTCSKIFTDLLHHVLVKPPQVVINQALPVPGFPHPLFGSIRIVPGWMDNNVPQGDIWGTDQVNDVSVDDRTMFLTFSRGFPVSENEVRELFTRLYGDCVESVWMQENGVRNEQALFARMILRSISIVDRILNGKRIAKFHLNGKHIWIRKYERR